MTLANIRKEEVDPLLAQIKNLMTTTDDNNNNDHLHPCITEDENLLVLDQLAETSAKSQSHLNSAQSFKQSSRDITQEAFDAVPSTPPSHMITDHYQQGIQDTLSSQTVDMLMRELLKPMLKDWLEAHLPSLVKLIVNEQIEKLMKQYQESIQSDSELNK